MINVSGTLVGLPASVIDFVSTLDVIWCVIVAPYVNMQ